MTRVFDDLGFQVEACPDIFSALERVTGRSFDVILADLDHGPEAGFLLKTARELKLNKNAFAFAVGTGTAYAQPQEFGVELVLAKPIIPDQVKYALLDCDGFLACMRSWSVEADAEAKRIAAPQPSPPLPAKRAEARPSASKSPMSVPEPSPQVHTGIVKKTTTPSIAPANTNSWPVKAAPATPSASTQPRSSPAQQKKPSVPSKVLWSTTLTVSILAFGYGVSRPGLKVLASTTGECREVLARVYDRASAIAKSDRPEKIQTADAGLIIPESPPTRIRVAFSASHSNSARHQPPAQISTPDVERSPRVVDPQSEVRSLASRTPRIPESILHSPPETETAQSAPLRQPSLMGQLEPVSLPEDVSDELLSEKVQPSYPEQALKSGLQGAVVLQAWIGIDGKVRDLKLVRGSLLLGQAAYKAVKQWRYKPYQLNGVAVEAQTFVTVNFRLPQQSLLLPATH
jgi:TonB family protein